MTEVELPDGTIAEFPDGMSQEQIRAALRRQFAPEQPEPSFGDKAGAVGRAAWEGLRSPARFAEQLIGKAGIPYLSEGARLSDEEARRALADARKTAPIGAAVGETVGAALNPLSIAAMGAFPGGPAVTSTLRGILAGGAKGAGQGALFGLTQPVENPDDMLKEKAAQVGYSTAGGGLGGALGGAWQGRAASRAAAQQTNATQDAAAEAARAAGYTLPPTTTNPTIFNRLMEGLAGKLTTAQQASIQNQQITNSLVRKALGLADDAPITKETLAALRKNAGAAYEAVASVPKPFVADEAFTAGIAKLREQTERMAAQFPSLVNKDVTALLDDLSKGVFDPRVAVDASKQMRFEASRTLNSFAASPQQTAYARAQKEAANRLENLIASNLKNEGLDDLFSAWQAARIQIAKAKNVEKALNDSTGNVVAAKIAKQMDAGSPLTNELRTVANAAKAFPKATREVTESMPGISPLDYFGGVGLGAVTGNPAAMLAPLARPVARSTILSPAYQRMFGSPGYSMGLLADPLAEPLLTGAGAAGLLTYGTR